VFRIVPTEASWLLVSISKSWRCCVTPLFFPCHGERCLGHRGGRHTCYILLSIGEGCNGDENGLRSLLLRQLSRNTVQRKKKNRKEHKKVRVQSWLLVGVETGDKCTLFKSITGLYPLPVQKNRSREGQNRSSCQLRPTIPSSRSPAGVTPEIEFLENAGAQQPHPRPLLSVRDA